MTPLLAAALGLLGLIAGIYVSMLIHDHRIGDLSAEQYVAMHQMRDKTFRRVMPVMALATLGLMMAGAIFAVGAGTPRALALIAVVLLATDAVLTIARQLPLNARIQSWTAATIPEEWSQARDRWAAQHRMRMVLGLAAYGCFLAAVLSAPIP
jgi:hypothetical protein